MGQYYQKPEQLKTVGRPLGWGSYQMLIRQLQPGEQLVGCYDKLVYLTAPFLPDEREFNHFEERYNMGGFVGHSFYAVKTEEVST